MLTLPMLHEYAEKLPANSAYYRWASRLRPWAQEELAPGERHRLVFGDPAFGWNCPSGYVRAHQPMPLFIQEQKGLLVRVFNYQSRRDTRDGALALAHSLWADPTQRPILEALLLASNSTVLDLAQRFQVPPKTILLYQRLFYNVRGRIGNPGFVAQLVGWPGQTDSRRLRVDEGFRNS
jgi:hypothetical protein